MFDMSAYQRARAARLKSVGICVVCGAAQALKNRTRCRACGADGSRRTLKWIARRQSRTSDVPTLALDRRVCSNGQKATTAPIVNRFMISHCTM
jgi:hypothetical protein